MLVSSRPILLTGGTGFIGYHLARHLVAADVETRALDTLLPQVHRDPAAAAARFPGELIVGDVRDPAAVARAVSGCGAVVHLAAETGVGQSMYETDRYTSVNVQGTSVVLAAAAAEQVPVVVLSSRAVYGQGATQCPEHGRQTGVGCCSAAQPSASIETDPFAPVSVYGQTKADAERITHTYADDGLPTVILRPQNVIGPGQALHNPYTGVLAAFAARVRQGLPPLVYGTGTQTRDFIAVEDIARIITALLADVDAWAAHPVLNVGSGRRTTLQELAEQARRWGGIQAPLEYVDITRPGDIDHACADLLEAQAAGIPAAEVPFDVSVDAFLDYAAGQATVDPAIWDDALTELSTHNETGGPA